MDIDKFESLWLDEWSVHHPSTFVDIIATETTVSGTRLLTDRLPMNTPYTREYLAVSSSIPVRAEDASVQSADESAGPVPDGWEMLHTCED